MGVDAKKAGVSLGPTSEKRVARRHKLLKSYLRREGFRGVWLDRTEVEEVVALLEKGGLG